VTNFKIKNNYLSVLLIVVLLLFPLLDMFHAGFPLTHDGKDHLARIANFYLNLKEGNIVPRWAGLLNWGYGHPILMFLYPLPSYAISFIHFSGLNIADSTKLFFGLTYVISGVAMYLFAKKLLNNEYAGVIAALLYALAPYRFVDLYVRGALGEHTAFIFPPLIGYFMLRVKKKCSSWEIIGLAVSTAGLLLSHNAVSLMFLPFLVLFTVYILSLSKDKKTVFFQIVTGILIGFGLAAFFWIPAFAEGKYTLRDVVIGDEYKNSFVSLKNLLYGPWDYGGTGKFTVQLGIVQWLVVLGGLFVLFTTKDKNIKKILLTCLIILFASLFLMTQSSVLLWEKISVLPKFQFPWRFLTVSVFISSIIGAYVITNLKINKLFLLVSFVAALLIFNSPYWKAQSYAQFPDKLFKKIYFGTTDTGESAPRWSVRFMEKTYKHPLEVLEGDAEIRSITKAQTYHLYAIDAKEDTRLLENTLYFPDWKVKVDNKEVPIEYQDRNHHGLMTFHVPEGLHKVEVVFGDTKIRQLANSLSILSIILLIILGILRRSKIWRQYQLF
jgi:uncharacterized membrane protein